MQLYTSIGLLSKFLKVDFNRLMHDMLNPATIPINVWKLFKSFRACPTLTIFESISIEVKMISVPLTQIGY